ASAGLSLRKAKQLRVRLPLSRLTVVSGDPASLEAYRGLLADELNVRKVELAELREDSLTDFGITRRLSVNARALGPRLGRQVQEVIAAAKAGDWSAVGDDVTVGGFALSPGEFELVLESADPANAIEFLSDGAFVVLDTEVTPALEAEGLARDLIRQIQD